MQISRKDEVQARPGIKKENVWPESAKKSKTQVGKSEDQTQRLINEN